MGGGEASSAPSSAALRCSQPLILEVPNSAPWHPSTGPWRCRACCCPCQRSSCFRPLNSAQPNFARQRHRTCRHYPTAARSPLSRHPTIRRARSEASLSPQPQVPARGRATKRLQSMPKDDSWVSSMPCFRRAKQAKPKLDPAMHLLTPLDRKTSRDCDRSEKHARLSAIAP